MKKTDPRLPFLIGILAIGVLTIVGIVWAVAFAPSEGMGRFDVNAAFVDDGDPSFGAENASVVIRLFEDLQCSACAVGAKELSSIRQKFNDRVKFVWNDVPLEMHPHSRIAANAARCAEEQGVFWEYADLLFASQSDWATQQNPRQRFISYAERLSLRVDVFSDCLDERRYDEKIRRDMDEARANRVDATPTFFINNDRFVGVLSSQEWETELNKRLGISVTSSAGE